MVDNSKETRSLVAVRSEFASLPFTATSFLPRGNSPGQGLGNPFTCSLCNRNQVFTSPSFFVFNHWCCVLHVVCKLLFSLHLTWGLFHISNSRTGQCSPMGIWQYTNIPMNGPPKHTSHHASTDGHTSRTFLLGLADQTSKL